MKPYLAYYDNFKNFSDYSFENPICFLCKEETILFSVWEVGTFHLSSGGKSVSYYKSRSVGLFAKNKSLHFLEKKKFSLPSPTNIFMKTQKREAPPLLSATVAKIAFMSLAWSRGNF